MMTCEANEKLCRFEFSPSVVAKKNLNRVAMKWIKGVGPK